MSLSFLNRTARNVRLVMCVGRILLPWDIPLSYAIIIPDMPLRNLRRMNVFWCQNLLFYVVTRYIHTVVQHCLGPYHHRSAKPIVLHRYPPRGLI
jgi:hypothetical protein